MGLSNSVHQLAQDFDHVACNSLLLDARIMYTPSLDWQVQLYWANLGSMDCTVLQRLSAAADTVSDRGASTNL